MPWWCLMPCHGGATPNSPRSKMQEVIASRSRCASWRRHAGVWPHPRPTALMPLTSAHEPPKPTYRHCLPPLLPGLAEITTRSISSWLKPSHPQLAEAQPPSLAGTWQQCNACTSTSMHVRTTDRPPTGFAGWRTSRCRVVQVAVRACMLMHARHADSMHDACAITIQFSSKTRKNEGHAAAMRRP